MHVPNIHIEIERLILRAPQAGNFDACATNRADAEARHFIHACPPRVLAGR